MTITKEKYRRWIKNRYGTIHKDNKVDKYKTRKWRINQNHIRETIMDEYIQMSMIPAYMITRTYHYDQQLRSEVVSHNDRMNRVIDDFFNPRGIDEYVISKDHFIERHKDKLQRVSQQNVLNTISNEYERDWRMEVKKGGLHTHTLISNIDDDLICKPSKRVRDAIEHIYGIPEIPISLRDDQGLIQVKTDLLDYALRKRCDFIGNSNMSLDIIPTDEYGSYEGYRGWKGAVAYVTKKMYNVDNIVDIYDKENSIVLDTE